MKRLFVAALVLALTTGFAAIAKADTVSLSLANRQGFTFASSTGAVPTFTNQSAPTVPPIGHYTLAWSVGSSTAVTGTIISPAISLGSAGDTFVLTVQNTNENPWTFTVAVVGGGGGSSSASIAAGAAKTFSISLTGAITAVTLTVGATIPINSFDQTAEFSLVPEPASLSLLGVGLLGLMGLLRRRAS